MRRYEFSRKRYFIFGDWVFGNICIHSYTVSILSKEPDPLAEFGMSLNAIMASMVAFGAFLVAFAVVLAAGVSSAMLSLLLPIACLFPELSKG